jgi:hypothetical protein
MKLDIKKDGDAVEIHLANDDGSITVWLCDSQEVALYKLASILFSRPEGDKRAKRSILVGTFEEKAVEKKVSLSERSKVVKERLVKGGLAEKSDGELAISPDIEKMIEAMKQLPQYSPYQVPLAQPFIHKYDPNLYPQVGDFTVGGVGAGLPPGNIGWPGTICMDPITDVVQIDVNFTEKNLGKMTFGNSVANVFKCSSNAGQF